MLQAITENPKKKTKKEKSHFITIHEFYEIVKGFAATSPKFLR